MKTWLTLLAFLGLCIAMPSQARTFKTEQWKTHNGARVVFYPAMEVPMLDMSITFAAGSAYDGKRFGLSALTTQLMDQGSGKLNANQIAERLADTGAQFGGESSRDMVVLQLKTLTEAVALRQSIETFSMIVNQPSFHLDAFIRQRNQQLIAITQKQESPDEVANMAFFDKLYQNHPYGHPVNGTLESVKSITLNQVREFYRRYFVANNAIIVIVGAVDSDKAHELAEQLVQSLPAGEAAKPIPKASPLEHAETAKINFPSSQTILRLGQLGISHNDAEYFPLMVGNYILGGGSMVSQLSQEVREKRGLTYGISSQFIPMPGDGPFIIGLSTKTNQADMALKLTQDTLTQFIAQGPSEDELSAAKQYLVGSFPLSLASNSSIAGMLLRITFYQLPSNYLDTYTAYIESVSIEDIKKAFISHLTPKNMLLVTVGKT